MGSKDLAEKNLLQYKDVFSDIVNVNLFGGRHYISANELSREPGELITKSSSDNKLKQLQMDVPMKCNKKYNTRFFVCLENQSDINNIMPVRDMGKIYGAGPDNQRGKSTAAGLSISYYQGDS